MKTKTKKGIFYLGFAFLLCLSSIFPCFLIENTVHETDIQEKNRLKLSSQNINVITPENKTYIGGMQGYYPATYGFEHDVDGSNPIGWILGEPIDTSIQVDSELDGHKKILELYDNSNTQYLNCHNTFLDKTSGTIEFYFRVDDGSGTDNTMHFMLNEGGSHIIWLRYLNGGLLYRYPGGWESISLINIDTWYHVRIDFECDAGGYKGLSADKVDIYINDVIRVSDGDFTIPSIGINTLVFATDNTYTFNAFHCYIDAVGYSWDNNYNIGDNLYEGILISYTNSTTLDWVGYSLDGQENQTIYGNTTIPSPNDGIHNIQLFCNDTLGAEYYSNLRWFNIQEFSHLYTEDFTTTTYQDESFTNSSGWGSGVLYSPYKNLTIDVFETPTNWRSNKIQIIGDIAYSAYYYGLEIYDISNPSEPNLLSSYSDYGCYDFILSGNYAYIAAYYSGFIILDISNPNSPTLLGKCDNYQTHDTITTLYSTAIDIEGSYAYIYDMYQGLIVINIANPSAPFKTGDWQPVVGFLLADNLIINGNYLYLIEGGELTIFDIGTPTAPTDVHKYTSGLSYDTGLISGNHIYLVGQYTMDILNIVSPTSPSLVSSTQTGVYGVRQGIALDGSLIYIGGERIVTVPSDYYFEGIVEAYDVSNIANPQHEYTFVSPCTNPSHNSIIDAIDVANGLSFMSDFRGYYIIADFNLIDQREPVTTAQSLTVYSGSANILLTHALLEVSEDLPPDTGITYYLSADNGIHWEMINPYSIHKFEYIGNQLKWMAILTSSHEYRTPQLNSLGIAYLPLLNRTTLLSPLNLTITDDNTPYFEWEDLPEATEYIIQLDTSKNFSSVNYQYQRVSNNYWTASSFLLNGIWYWRVAGIDSKNDVGLFSDYFLIQIDVDDLVPTSDHPVDILTVQGGVEYVRWVLNDDHGGGSYQVMANNSLGNFYVCRAWESWIVGQTVSIPINRTAIGDFNYMIEYYDNYNQYGVPDTVLVTVNQNNPPTSNHPDDITTPTDGTETIQWILSDDYGGGSYRVIITTSAGASSTWMDWRSWDIDVPLNIQIDRTRTGVFNYTIEYRDMYSVYGMADTVKVTIPGEEFPIVLLLAIVGGAGVVAVVIPVIYLKRRKN